MRLQPRTDDVAELEDGVVRYAIVDSEAFFSPGDDPGFVKNSEVF